MLDSNQTIILPINEDDYIGCINSRFSFRKRLDDLIEQYPEIFPCSIKQGYYFYGWSKSDKKISLPRRIIRLKNTKGAKDYLVHPCYVMPYLRGNTIEVSKGLYLRKYNTPYHAIAATLNKDAMYWYRAELSLSRYNIVGTTVKSLANMPQHLLVDEHHSRLQKEKVYACTTVGADCFLSVALSSNVSYESLEKAYGIFKNEVAILSKHYQPLTINTDGFQSTMKAASALYPQATLILCFLHAYLKIQNCGTKAYDDYFQIVATKVWSIYRADTKRAFAQQIRRLSEWTDDFVPDSAFKSAIKKLCKKK